MTEHPTKHSSFTPDQPCLDLKVLREQTPVDWPNLRSHFLLDESLTYLNTGTLGACPDCVLQAAWNTWTAVEQNPSDCGFGSVPPTMEYTRERAAEFIGCGKDEVAIIENTTVGMHHVAQGLHLKQGDHVLTTNHEHVGGRLCWDYYAKHTGIVIDVVELPVLPLNAADVLDRFANRLTPDVKVISISHVTYSGLRLPIRELSAMARERDILIVVDGAQAVGMVPVNVKELGCHTYANSSHKWVLAPKGTGLLYRSEEISERIQPLPLMHGNGAYTAATGTRSAASIVGLGTAISFHQALGVERAYQRLLELRAILYNRLQEVGAIRIVSPAHGEMASALVVFALPEGIESGKFRMRLKEEYGIIVRAISPDLVNGIRISTHIYNNEEDIDRLLCALKKELVSAGGGSNR